MCGAVIQLQKLEFQKGGFDLPWDGHSHVSQLHSFIIKDFIHSS